MPDKLLSSDPLLTRRKYILKVECVRQVVAGARQTDMAHSQDLLSGRWQRHALAEVALTSAEREKIKLLRAEFKCMEQEHAILKKRLFHL
jgi:transposase